MANRLLDLVNTNPDIVKKLNGLTNKDAVIDLLAKEIPNYTEDELSKDAKEIVGSKIKTGELNLDDLEEISGGLSDDVWKTIITSGFQFLTQTVQATAQAYTATHGKSGDSDSTMNK